MKRYRRPNVKPGQLTIHHGKLDGEWDTIYSWGEGCSKRDGNLLHYLFASKRWEPALGAEERANSLDGRYFLAPSAMERLEEAGYDLTTLKFSIEKKKQGGQNDPQAL